MADEIPAGLLAYFDARERERTERVTAALEARTPAERVLMKEAAVMGYVQGMQAGLNSKIPPDSAVLRSVVAACLAMPDLYPAISAPETTPDAPGSDARPQKARNAGESPSGDLPRSLPPATADGEIQCTTTPAAPAETQAPGPAVRRELPGLTSGPHRSGSGLTSEATPTPDAPTGGEG